MSVLVWAGVTLIGGAGSVLRFYVDGLVSSASGRDFPFGTLAVNLSGAVLLGLIAGLALSGDAALLAGTAKITCGQMMPWRGGTRFPNRCCPRLMASSSDHECLRSPPACLSQPPT